MGFLGFGGVRALVVLALSCVFAGSAAATPQVAATPEALARTLPAVSTLVDELSGEPAADLRHYRRALLARLLLDQGRVAVQDPQALHDAMVLAALCVVLSEHPEGRAAGDALSLVEATYTLHAAGHAYATRPSLRAALADLQRATKAEGAREIVGDLERSAADLEALGRRWFPIALHAALDEVKVTRTLDLLRGLWLEREGRLGQAAQALGRAVKDKATVATTIDLVRILARSGEGERSRRLAERLGQKAPGARGTLSAILLAAADERASEDFRRRRGAPSLGERRDQVARDARQGRVAEAEGMLHDLVTHHLGAEGVFDLAAGLYLRWRRLGRLERLIDHASRLATPPARLAEARVAAVVAARLAGAQGATTHGLASLEITADLVSLSQAPQPALRRFSAHAALVLAALDRDETRLKTQSARALQVELSTQSLEVIAAAWLSLGRMDRAIVELEQGLPRLAPSERAPLSLALASLELSVGAGRGDRGLLRKGLERLGAVEVQDPSLVAEKTYLEAVGGRIAAWLGSAAPGAGGPGASDDAALKGLLPLVDRVDPTRPRGAVVAAAATLSAGALGLSLGAYDLAVGAFQIARRLNLSPYMAGLAVGQVALAADDAAGAAVALQRAVDSATTQVERFLAHKWRALAANRSGAPGEAKEHFQAMLEGWKSARAPRRKEGRQPVALLLGGVEIAATMPPDGPVRLEAVLTATPVLAADFPHDKRSIQRLIDATGGAKGRGK